MKTMRVLLTVTVAALVGLAAAPIDRGKGKLTAKPVPEGKATTTVTPQSNAGQGTDASGFPSASVPAEESETASSVDPAAPSVTPEPPGANHSPLPYPLATSTAAYQIPWQCVSSGGHPATSASYETNATVGQPCIGYSSSNNYEQGSGYWYGAMMIATGCLCPHQADLDGNTFIDATDLAIVIDVVFFGGLDVSDPDCPTSRSDFNADGFADATDLAMLIDHVFFGGSGPWDGCGA